MKKPSNYTRGMLLLLSLLSAGGISSSNALLHGPVLQSLPLLRQQPPQPHRFLFSSRRDHYPPTIFQTSTLSTTTTSRTALLTTPLLHMGHSHAHHHHHQNEEKDNTTTTSKPLLTTAQKAQRFRRRVALWMFCLVAILGPKLLGRKQALQQSDGVVLIISILALSSADTLRRNLLYYWQKVQSFGQAIMKHSSSSNTKHSSKSNVLQALSNTNNNNHDNNDGGTSSSSSAATTAMRDTTEADRVTWIGVVINIVLSVGKLVVGVTQHSSYVYCYSTMLSMSI